MGILFQSLAKWDEKNINRPKFTADRSILFANGNSNRPLSNSYFKRCCNKEHNFTCSRVPGSASDDWKDSFAFKICIA